MNLEYESLVLIAVVNKFYNISPSDKKVGVLIVNIFEMIFKS